VLRKERAEQAKEGEVELGVGELVELPLHMCTGGGKQWCCLEWLLSEQDDFKKQENAVREYIKSQGHECTFLPKSHPGICLSLPLAPSPLLFFNFMEEPCLKSPHVHAHNIAFCSFSELNFIERYCGRVKWYMRENCDYSVKNL